MISEIDIYLLDSSNNFDLIRRLENIFEQLTLADQKEMISIDEAMKVRLIKISEKYFHAENTCYVKRLCLYIIDCLDTEKAIDLAQSCLTEALINFEERASFLHTLIVQVDKRYKITPNSYGHDDYKDTVNLAKRILLKKNIIIPNV